MFETTFIAHFTNVGPVELPKVPPFICHDVFIGKCQECGEPCHMDDTMCDACFCTATCGFNFDD